MTIRSAAEATARAQRFRGWRLRSDTGAYGDLARFLHWVTPVLLIGSFGLVWSLSYLPVGPDRVQAVSIHRTIGLIVLALTTGRVIWRFLDHYPELVGPRPLRWVAASVHAMLYAALLATPLLGWTYTNARGHKLAFLGLPLPSVIMKDEYFSRVAITAHEWLAYTLLCLLAVHIAAALWHHWVLRDQTLKRMTLHIRPPTVEALQPKAMGRRAGS